MSYADCTCSGASSDPDSTLVCTNVFKNYTSSAPVGNVEFNPSSVEFNSRSVEFNSTSRETMRAYILALP